MLILILGIVFLSIYIGRQLGIGYGILFLLVELMIVRGMKKNRY
ncbi:hypothetical protein [Sporanaerobacter sp. PP17-6a]|nr:hypothetical protein [Sporanaerobacter sp. PP17-6a]